MPTYEYRCDHCGLKFERRQSMKEPRLETCPECGGNVRRIISGGAGFILKGSGCSLERTGATCCGRAERCGKPACGGERSR